MLESIYPREAQLSTESAVAGVAGEGPRYGAGELQALYKRYLFRGLAIAIAAHAMVIGGYYAAAALGAGEPPVVHVRLLRYSDLGPPPSIESGNAPPPVAIAPPRARVDAGVPVPVPDLEVNADQTIATQHEMNEGTGPGGEGGGSPGGTGIPGDIAIDDEAPPADYVAVEKEPVIIKSVEPVYPEMAVKTGLEGKVWVKIWVDREGKPKQVVILQSDNEMFNQPALDAAKQFVFTPAYMNDGPVSVWVTFPFKFTLSGDK